MKNNKETRRPQDLSKKEQLKKQEEKEKKKREMKKMTTGLEWKTWRKSRRPLARETRKRLAVTERPLLTLTPHPPNSPDLSACDFWLFDLIKLNLSDQTDSQSLHDAITELMYSLDKEEYRKTFDKWMERMQLCVDNQGDYFEHLMK